MKRLALVIAALGAMVVGIVILAGGPREGMRQVRDARALAALPQRDVAPMLDLQDGVPEVVVFQDGSDGWFELDFSALPADTQIGFHQPRLIDMLGGGTHVAIYCGGSGRPGKILWAVRDGQIAAQYAFCNPRRMDLGPLRPLAEPVEMVERDLPRDALLSLRAEVEADPARAVISGPLAMGPFTQRYIVSPPLMWYITGQTPTRASFETAIEAQIISHLGEAQMAFRRRPSTNPNLTYPSADGQGPSVTGMAIAHNGTFGILPGVWGEPQDIWIDCLPESCVRLETLDFDGLFEEARDIAGLRAALPDMVESPYTDGSPTPLDWYPTLPELEATDTRIAEPIALTYNLRYIQRAQSE